MRALGFRTLLPDALQAPIIVTFHMPQRPEFVFQRFYDGLKDRGFVIYPGKLTVADSFRIGCIGRLYPKDMSGGARGGSRGARGNERQPARRRRGIRRKSPMNMLTTTGREVVVNGRRYRFPQTPTIVVCIDGSEPGYIEAAIERGLAPNLRATDADRLQPPRSLGHPELHQPEQHLDHHGRAARGTRHRRQLLLRSGGREGSDDERGAFPARAETIMQAFHDAGAKVAVVTAKDKLRSLLGNGLDMSTGRAIAFSSEKADKANLRENGIEDVLAFVGMPLPDVYSRRTYPSSCSRRGSRSWNGTGPTSCIFRPRTMCSTRRRPAREMANASTP